MTEKITGLALLRVPFLPNQISKLPKPLTANSTKGNCKECGGYHGLPAVHLDYVGHAALTDRLLDADPTWTWEHMTLDSNGNPTLDREGGMWIKLTVCGVTRLGYGDAQGKIGGNAMKERIGDALRNAAMRFGAALDLWHKGVLHEVDYTAEAEERRTKWLTERLAEISAAPNVGELNKIMDVALSKARENFDADAEDQLKGACAAKVPQSKPKYSDVVAA